MKIRVLNEGTSFIKRAPQYKDFSKKRVTARGSEIEVTYIKSGKTVFIFDVEPEFSASIQYYPTVNRRTTWNSVSISIGPSEEDMDRATRDSSFYIKEPETVTVQMTYNGKTRDIVTREFSFDDLDKAINSFNKANKQLFDLIFPDDADGTGELLDNHFKRIRF